MGWDKGIVNPKFQAFDSNGDPLSGGLVYTYESGTDTPKTTYSDRDLGTPNTNPVELNSRGEASIYASGLIKIILQTSAGGAVWTMDDMRITQQGILADDDNDTKVQVEETADEDKIRFDCGGTEQIRLEDGALLPTTNNDIDLGDSTHGYKKSYIGSVHLDEQASAPATAAGQLATYSKDENGQPELFAREESSGGEVEITKGGHIAVPPGYLHGLTLSNDTDTEHDINITAGLCADSTGLVTLKLASEITKKIDENWAVGDDVGGLFTGSAANDTWYHVFLIRKDSDGTIDAGFNTSITAANIPTGYTKYRRIGSVLTDGSANIIAFSHLGDQFLWKDPPLDIDDATPDTTANTGTLSTPLGVKTNAILNGATDGGVNLLYISSLDVNDEAPSSTAAPLAQFGGNSTYLVDHAIVRTNTSSQIRYRCTVNVAIGISTLGWLDRRGRDN